MKIKLLRNATLLVESGSSVLLIDPMFANKGAIGPFPYLKDTRHNPLVDLPFSSDTLQELIDSVDAVLITHLHPDHWDFAAQKLLPKNTPIYCQPGDKAAIIKAGFLKVQEIESRIDIFNVSVYRTNGKHGLGEIGKIMGPVSGFVIEDQEEKVYVAGDTVWCEEVTEAIDQFKPDRIIINGGGATFNKGGHVTMNQSDLFKIYQFYPKAKYYVVHLEAVTPVRESRSEIQKYLGNLGLIKSFTIPNDGEYLY